MKVNLIICSLISTIVLIGCSQDEPIRTVNYYIQNEDERKNKLAYCNESSNRRTETNCINAQDAQAKETRKTMRNEGIPRR